VTVEESLDVGKSPVSLRQHGFLVSVQTIRK